MEKFLEYLQEAEKIVKAVDHMVYVTFPLIKDKKILLKVMTEMKKSLAYCINAILQYEYIYKQINLHKDTKTNLKIFVDQSSKRFEITQEEIKKILDLFEIVEAHKASPMEFMKGNNVIILSERMERNMISLEKIKEFLTITKNILKKTKNRIIPNY